MQFWQMEGKMILYTPDIFTDTYHDRGIQYFLKYMFTDFIVSP